MSLKMTGLVWNDAEIRNPNDRLVMLALADHSDDTGLSWPSIDRLKQMTALSESSIYRSVARLKESKKVLVESGGGRHKVNKYKITLSPRQGINPVTQTVFRPETLSNSEETLSNSERNPVRLTPQPSVNRQEQSVLSLSSGLRNGKEKQLTDARVLIHFLNEQAGRSYRETNGTFKLICARLEEVDGDVEGIKAMIVRQVKRWRGSEMEEYLRPETLFGKTKFNSYYDNRKLPLPPAGKTNTKLENSI